MFCRPLLGEEGPGNEARNYLHVASDQVETKCERGREFFHESKK